MTVRRARSCVRFRGALCQHVPHHRCVDGCSGDRFAIGREVCPCCARCDASTIAFAIRPALRGQGTQTFLSIVKSPAINASFLARLQGFNCASRWTVDARSGHHSTDLRHTLASARHRGLPRASDRSERVEWWRRRESNPRPKARRRGTLHACPLRNFRARRVEAAKYRRALSPVKLAGTRRGATCPPACLMAFGPQPPGEVKANVTA